MYSKVPSKYAHVNYSVFIPLLKKYPYCFLDFKTWYQCANWMLCFTIFHFNNVLNNCYAIISFYHIMWFQISLQRKTPILIVRVSRPTRYLKVTLPSNQCSTKSSNHSSGKILLRIFIHLKCLCKEKLFSKVIHLLLPWIWTFAGGNYPSLQRA